MLIFEAYKRFYPSPFQEPKVSMESSSFLKVMRTMHIPDDAADIDALSEAMESVVSEEAGDGGVMEMRITDYVEDYFADRPSRRTIHVLLDIKGKQRYVPQSFSSHFNTPYNDA